MLTAAPNASLTSSTNNWAAYYTYLFYQKITGAAIDRNWHAGYEAGAVGITDLNGNAFKTDISGEIKTVVDKIVAGELMVFDCSTFTVNGQHISEYMADVIPDAQYQADTQVVKTTTIGGKEVKYVSESTFRSAPYFALRIDGINEI